MILYDIEHRNQLERLHDRHKNLSLEVYDHLTAKEEKEMLEKHTQMKEVEKEMADFKKIYFPD